MAVSATLGSLSEGITETTLAKVATLREQGAWELASDLWQRLVTTVGPEVGSRGLTASLFVQEAYLLALSFLQIGKPAKAQALLGFLGCEWCLSSSVLLESELADWDGPSQPQDLVRGRVTPIVVVVEELCKGPLLKTLVEGFGPHSTFWDFHRYFDGATPFFSYVHMLGRPPGNALEAVIENALAALKGSPLQSRMKAVKWVEVWAHTRQPDDAHQLHFDLDESRLRRGKAAYSLKHPDISSVLFLGECGGATVILNQTPQSDLAEEAWKVHPHNGRLLAFEGNLLHGVLPGPRALQTSVWRTTLILAWWSSIEEQPDPESFPVPKMRLPRSSDPNPPPWLQAFHVPDQDWKLEPPRFICPTPLSPAWQSVRNLEPCCADKKLSGTDIDAATTWGDVVLPPLRFFLRSKDEIRRIYGFR